jgi:Ser/Thr protein kinase RdoA (MazF antagonist)
VPARSGSPAVAADERVCVLFEWIRGRPLWENPVPEHVHAAGALTARVHEHGADYLTDAPAGALMGDRVLDFQVDDRLSELRPRYGSVLVEAVARAQQVLDELWRNPPHPAHLLDGDVQPGNVMVNRGAIALIDFQDLFWGFEVQDVQIAVLALAAYGDGLGGAFRAGYETQRPWPEAAPDTVAALHAARHLDILNFGLSIRRPGFAEFVARHAEPVIAWMGRGASRA